MRLPVLSTTTWRSQQSRFSILLFAFASGVVDAVTHQANSYEALNNAISASAEGDTIQLEPGTYFFTAAISITKALNIEGTGGDCILDGSSMPSSNLFGMMSVAGTPRAASIVSIRSLTFQNARARWGAAVFVWAGKTLQMTDVTFIDGVASDSGGAVYNYLGTATFTRCRFLFNTGAQRRTP